MERLTSRTASGVAYLVNVKQDEQEVECKSRNTAQCIMDSWGRLADYEDTGLEPSEIMTLSIDANSAFGLCREYEGGIEKQGEIIRKLQADLSRYRKAEEEGRLPELPCTVGSTIYVIPSETNYRLNKISHPENNRVYEQIVASISWRSNDRYLLCTCGGICGSLSDDFGVTWFLTIEEAEAALRTEASDA